MSVWSPARGCKRNFLMNLASAKRYYRQWSSSVLEAKVMFRQGSKLMKPNNPRDLYIWGENISDSELFKRRLNGSVDKETLES